MTIRERIAAVLEAHPELEGREPDLMGIACNGCGRVAAGTIEQVERETSEWRLGDHLAGEDYCPGCLN